MAEALLHNSWVDASLERQRRPGVAQAVEGEAPQAVPAYSAEEHLADCVWVEPAASELVEHEASVVEVGAHEQALSSMRRRCPRITATEPVASAIGRRPCVVLGSPIITWLLV